MMVVFIYVLSVRRVSLHAPSMIPLLTVNLVGNLLQRDMYDHLSRALSYLDFIKNMHMAAPDIFAKCATSLACVWFQALISAHHWSLLRICAVLDHRIKRALPLSPISLTTRGRCVGTNVVGTR